MLAIPRSFRNVVYKFRGIQEVGESNNIIYYKCLKCGGELKGNKEYGTLRILCTCGHAANVYTGKNSHFKHENKVTIPKPPPTKEERDRLNEERRIDVFEKYLSSDLAYLYGIISNKRDITKQVRCKDCIKMLNSRDEKEGYEKITKYLQGHCDLESVSLNVVWEPLDNQHTLGSVERDTNIMGTTYPLQMKTLQFYTIYLNPKYILARDLMTATIAHELSHIYASNNNIHFAPSDNERGINAYNEQMTDLLGIVLGMGDLLCTSLNRSETFDTGYLTNDMLCQSHSLWKSDYLSGKNKDIKTLAVCEQCSQNLKVPIAKEKIQLVCPKCKSAFEYRSF